MNGKRAKQLRRSAESKTVGREYTYYISGRYDSQGKQIPTILGNGCTRKVYKDLKRASK